MRTNELKNETDKIKKYVEETKRKKYIYIKQKIGDIISPTWNNKIFWW